MFKEKIIKYFNSKGIEVNRTEQEGDVESIVCHIAKSDNEKIESFREDMEKELDVMVAVSDMFGMNVAIVESKNLE